MKYSIHALAVLSCLALASCGTTSALRDSKGAVVTPSQKFTKVTVQDYTAKAETELKLGPLKAPKLKTPAAPAALGKLPGSVPSTAEEVAKGYFPDAIVEKLKKADFAKVSRNAKPDKDTLVIDGEVTKYSKGSALIRSLVGFGQGGTKFDATTRFKDSKGKVLGEMVTHMKSLPLPGTVTGPAGAIGQSAKDFVNSAAKKIADEGSKLAK